MNDLFGVSEFRTSRRKKSGEVRRKFPDFSISLKGKGKSGSTGLSLAGSPAKSGGLPFTPKGRNRRENSELRSDAVRLRFEIEKAEGAREAAEQFQRPFRDAFESAHADLDALCAARRRGAQVLKNKILKAYDTRLATGHAWHPHRRTLREAEAWLKALRFELTNINMELE